VFDLWFQVFELMKKEQPNYLEKVSAVIGDCCLPNLGIQEQYRNILKNEVITLNNNYFQWLLDFCFIITLFFVTKVNIVIHSAATVRFDEHLRKAVNINIIALQDMLKMSQAMKDLKVGNAHSYTHLVV